jgi:Ca-activated chloride channel family protein
VVSFAAPELLWLAWLPALAGALVVLRHLRRLRQQRRLASPGVWDRLMGGAPATGLTRMLSWCAAAALVAVSLARPQWGELPVEESVRTRDLVVALDVSDSMLSPDLRPTRIGRSLEVIRRALPGLAGNRLGVVVFAGDAYPLVPLTTDLSAVVAFLEGVAPQMVALPGSNLERAAEVALNLLPSEGEGRVVVFVTDGENLQGDVQAAAKWLRDAGVGVLAVVAGTRAGGPIPVPAADGTVHYKRDAGGQPVVTKAHPEVLAEIAAAVDGEVMELTDRDLERRLLAAVERLRTRELEETQSVRRAERFQLFLIAAAAAVTFGFALSPWRRLAAVGVVVWLSLLPAPLYAQAGPQESPLATENAQDSDRQPQQVSVSWWQRWIPGGSRRLARSGAAEWRDGELEQSARDFAGAAALDPDNPDRLYDFGTALAGGGALEAAAPVLERAHQGGAEAAAYNGGTAALQQGQAQPAVGWLRKALLADPDDPDVKRNYELALRLLEQQQQQNQQQKEPQQDQEQQKDRPTPTPQPQHGAPATPTPDPNSALYSALDRAEAEARDAMRSPTPQSRTVEKDW